MTQRDITRELENKFDVIVQWEHADQMYVEYVESGMGEPEMPDWMYDNISQWDYGHQTCEYREDRYGYGITIIFCEDVPA